LVQAQWGHLDDRDSFLTCAQALWMDHHHTIKKTRRSRVIGFVNLTDHRQRPAALTAPPRSCVRGSPRLPATNGRAPSSPGRSATSATRRTSTRGAPTQSDGLDIAQFNLGGGYRFADGRGRIGPQLADGAFDPTRAPRDVIEVRRIGASAGSARRLGHR
jgi:hypothetical protein